MVNERADAQRLATISDAQVHALRDALARHGYDGQMLGECESWLPGQFDAVRMPWVWHELRRREDPAAALARLFAYDDAVARARIETLLGADVVAALLGVDALYERDGGVTSRLRIVPFDTLWIASDDAARAIDPVMGPGPTTLELAAAFDTDGVASLLDVGCGAGSLALLAAARGVTSVVGVDIDPRALDYSR
ncbi:MAG TPA: methyltransferase domain-containing protein, partial [Nannocystaceae bacterium]|nr:methyltransferase domain-containing protein [Nannocystaceae bacterium]